MAVDEGLMLEELDGAEAGDCRASVSMMMMIPCEKTQSWARRTEDVGCVGIGIFDGVSDADEVGVGGARGMARTLFLENNAGSLIGHAASKRGRRRAGAVVPISRL